MDNRKYYNKPKIIDYDIDISFEINQCFCSCMVCKEDCPNYGKDLSIIKPNKKLTLYFDNGQKLILTDFKYEI